MKKYIYQYRLYIIGFLLICLVGSFWFVKGKESTEAAPVELNLKEEPAPSEVQTFKVDVKGAVVNPGVYEVTSGDRVNDAINYAGGILEESDIYYLNLSKRLEDQMTIYVYTKEEIATYEKSKVVTEYVEVPIPCNCPDTINDACSYPAEPSEPDKKSTKISINKASKEELMTLSGIGEAKAKDIISYRESQPFESIEDIMNVKGIGESVFAKIKDQIII